MDVCKHCGLRIVQVNWYDGPGWRHDRGDRMCPPVTAAEPVESLGRIRDRGPIKLSV